MEEDDETEEMPDELVFFHPEGGWIAADGTITMAAGGSGSRGIWDGIMTVTQDSPRL